MDNQNNQNEYTNFNGYQAAPAPDQQPIPQYAPVQQTPYNPYQVAVQPETKNKGLVLGILAIVLPIISCTLLSPISFILGLIGVIRNKKSAVSWVGLVISFLALAFLILYIVLIVQILKDPSKTREVLESSGNYSQSEIDEMLRQFYGFIVSML